MVECVTADVSRDSSSAIAKVANDCTVLGTIADSYTFDSNDTEYLEKLFDMYTTIFAEVPEA